ETTELLMSVFDDVASCAAAVGRIIAAGVISAGLEMMDGPAIRAVEAYAACGYPREAAALLLCELDGLAADVAADVARVQTIFAQSGATEVRRARDADER